MSFLFIGSHPAIDFLNTAYAPNGQLTETIGDGKAYLDWLVGAGLVEEEQAARLLRRLGVKSLDAAAVEARKIREWVREWLTSWRAHPRRDYSNEIAALNKLLAREMRSREVIRGKEGLQLVELPHIDSAESLIALVAVQLAVLLTEEDAALVKSCAGAGCTLWFLDRTKAHRRLFCSASGCGNRAKVAAFRERQRG